MQFGSLLFIVVFKLYLDFTSELLNQGVSLNNYILNHLKKNLVLYIKEDLLYKLHAMQTKKCWIMCVMVSLFSNNIAKELVPELLYIAL